MTKKPSVRDRAMGALNPQSGAAPSPTPAPVVSVGAGAPKTAPGMMMAFMAKQSDAIVENEQLKARLLEWDGASPARKIDPTLISESKWANRHSDSFKGKEFEEFKAEIKAAGGNVQPIKVRPKPGHPGQFEVVFGHRRLRACKELDIPVLALVEDVTDQKLFAEMDRENRSRADLRPFEQGVMYKRALEEGLFPSLRALATEVGVDAGNASRAIKIASLPNYVLGAFKTPLDIQFRWGDVLSDLAVKQPDLLADRAQVVAVEKLIINISAADIFARLTVDPATPPAAREDSILDSKGAVLAKIKNAGGRYMIEFEKSVKLDDKKLERLRKAIGQLGL